MNDGLRLRRPGGGLAAAGVFDDPARLGQDSAHLRGGSHQLDPCLGAENCLVHSKVGRRGCPRRRS